VVASNADWVSERIVVDGTAIPLGADTSGTTLSNAMDYSVTADGSRMIVTLSKAGGVSTAVIDTLVTGITYQNTSDDPLVLPVWGWNRYFALTGITDTGGTANGISDTSTLSIHSTVTVVAVNDAPTLTATVANPSFTEAAGVGTQAAAVSLFSGRAPARSRPARPSPG
jgi:hypothetical protein